MLLPQTAIAQTPSPLQEWQLTGVNYFFRWRLSFLPVLSLHHWSTIAH
jgi:hypothetical protein